MFCVLTKYCVLRNVREVTTEFKDDLDCISSRLLAADHGKAKTSARSSLTLVGANKSVTGGTVMVSVPGTLGAVEAASTGPAAINNIRYNVIIITTKSTHKKIWLVKLTNAESLVTIKNVTLLFKIYFVYYLVVKTLLT